ncbi:hypothetical protein EXIGLDRAFT_607832, partial [Exidia glandulosa HHB12029]
MRALPLVPGMPVIITHNYDIAGGVVNGSRGILKSIRYYIAADGRRHATSCIVTVPSSSDASFCGLPERDYPVMEETAEL